MAKAQLSRFPQQFVDGSGRLTRTAQRFLADVYRVISKKGGTLDVTVQSIETIDELNQVLNEQAAVIVDLKTRIETLETHHP